MLTDIHRWHTGTVPPTWPEDEPGDEHLSLYRPVRRIDWWKPLEPSFWLLSAVLPVVGERDCRRSIGFQTLLVALYSINLR